MATPWHGAAAVASAAIGFNATGACGRSDVAQAEIGGAEARTAEGR